MPIPIIKTRHKSTSNIIPDPCNLEYACHKPITNWIIPKTKVTKPQMSPQISQHNFQQWSPIVNLLKMQ